MTRRQSQDYEYLMRGSTYYFTTLGVRSIVHAMPVWKKAWHEFRRAKRARTKDKILTRLTKQLHQSPSVQIQEALKKEGLKVTTSSISRAVTGIGQNADQLLEAYQKLRNAGYFEHRNKRAFAEKSESGSRWVALKTLLRADGFLTESLPAGHRRPPNRELTGYKLRLSFEVEKAIGKDQRLERNVRKVINKLLVQKDPEAGPAIKRIVFRLIDAWDYKPAIRSEEYLGVTRGRLATLMHDRILIGENEDGKKLRFVGDPILFGAGCEQTFELLQRMLPPSKRGGRTSFGVCWFDRKKEPHPTDAEVAKIVFEMFQQLGSRSQSRISESTGFSRDEIRTMLKNRFIIERPLPEDLVRLRDELGLPKSHWPNSAQNGQTVVGNGALIQLPGQRAVSMRTTKSTNIEPQ